MPDTEPSVERLGDALGPAAIDESGYFEATERTPTALVQAVADALIHTVVPWGDEPMELSGIHAWTELLTIAEVAVAVLVPLIRAQVAEEIRAMPTHGLFGSDTYYVYREDAARIAEGTDHD
jgi:hypothetical protein